MKSSIVLGYDEHLVYNIILEVVGDDEGEVEDRSLIVDLVVEIYWRYLKDLIYPWTSPGTRI